MQRWPKEALQQLQRVIADPESICRAKAAELLAKLEEPEARALVRRLAGDPDPMVRAMLRPACPTCPFGAPHPELLPQHFDLLFEQYGPARVLSVRGYSPSDPDSLCAALRDPAARIRFVAMRMMALNRRCACVPLVVGQLARERSHAPYNLWQGVEVLVAVKESDGAMRIARRIVDEHPEHHTAADAAWTLGRLGSAEGYETLVRLFVNDNYVRWRRPKALVEFARLPGIDVVPVLALLSEDASEPVRLEVAHTLTKLGSPRALAIARARVATRGDRSLTLT